MTKTNEKKVESKEVAIIEKKTYPLIEKAKTQEVKNEDDKENATILLSQMNKVVDEITTFEDKIIAPLKEVIKEEQGRWKPYKTVFKEQIDRLRLLLGAYQTQEIKRQRAEEDKVASRVGEGKGYLKPETASRKMDEIEKPAAKVVTTAGSLSFRTDKILKITNESLIPDDFWFIDEKKVLEALKAGRMVPGAEIDEVQVPINRR